MTALLIFGGAILAWLVFSGKAKNMTPNQWLALVIALVGANFLRGGSWIMGGAMLAGAAFLSGWRILIPARDFEEPKRRPRSFELDRARSLLGVSDDAGFIEINAAWKQRLAEHHPDNGGDEQLAKMINRARDILLEELEASKRR
ncbi:J domain-containing protein [Parasphingorhabdus sp.]|uniref:J domain-containing protein n=1 Tax=Parasphingorhabdus sp. TaxID=2709688 RepID=UPI003593815B